MNVTRLVTLDGVVGLVAELKITPGSDPSINGDAALVRSQQPAGLIDNYILLTHQLTCAAALVCVTFP